MPLSRNLQEVVLAVHFAGPVPFTVTDLAAWIVEYGGTNASVQELAPLPTSQLPLVDQKPDFFNLNLLSSGGALPPRIHIRARDKKRLCILQNDRIGFGWERDVEIGETATYPGYQLLRGEWAAEVDRFSDWLQDRLSQALVPRLVELSYNNAYPVVSDGRSRRLAEVFKFLDPSFRRANSFHMQWSELLEAPLEGVVTAQMGLGNVPPGQRVFGVNYFGLASAAGAATSKQLTRTLLESADKLHDRIHVMHESAIHTGV